MLNFFYIATTGRTVQISFILLGISGSGFTWSAFLAGAFTSAVPGIILHIVLIPVLVMALERALPWLKNTK